MSVFGQDQKKIDSLINVYEQNNLKGSEKLQLLEDLAFNAVYDFELSIKYAQELISTALSEENDLYLSRGYITELFESVVDLEINQDIVMMN